MRALVVLAVLGACSAFPFIPDDPDVMAEKARFFRTFKVIEGASQPRIGGIPMLPSLPLDTFVKPPPQPKWTGPLASKVPASVPGATPFVENTAEVQHARGHFFNAYNSQVMATLPRKRHFYSPSPSPAPSPSPSPSPAPLALPPPIYVPDLPQKKWNGPLASQVPASVPGSSPVVFDTPDVHNAKAAFFDNYKRQVKAVMPRPLY